MPLTVRPRRKRSVRIIVTLLCGLLPVLLGSGILYMQAERTLQQSTQHTADEALRQFELMLDNTAQAASDLLPLAGQPCESVKLALREQVTRRPFVRSTNLVWDNNLYCSSLFGEFKEAVNPGDYAQGKLWLMNGNPVTPNTALLVYRLSEGRGGALTTLDGYHLSNVLRLIGRHTLRLLQVGDNWLSADGVTLRVAGQQIEKRAGVFALCLQCQRRFPARRDLALHGRRIPAAVQPADVFWCGVGRHRPCPAAARHLAQP